MQRYLSQLFRRSFAAHQMLIPADPFMALVNGNDDEQLFAHALYLLQQPLDSTAVTDELRNESVTYIDHRLTQDFDATLHYMMKAGSIRHMCRILIQKRDNHDLVASVFRAFGEISIHRASALVDAGCLSVLEIFLLQDQLLFIPQAALCFTNIAASDPMLASMISAKPGVIEGL